MLLFYVIILGSVLPELKTLLHILWYKLDQILPIGANRRRIDQFSLKYRSIEGRRCFQYFILEEVKPTQSVLKNCLTISFCSSLKKELKKKIVSQSDSQLKSHPQSVWTLQQCSSALSLSTLSHTSGFMKLSLFLLISSCYCGSLPIHLLPSCSIPAAASLLVRFHSRLGLCLDLMTSQSY